MHVVVSWLMAPGSWLLAQGELARIRRLLAMSHEPCMSHAPSSQAASSIKHQVITLSGYEATKLYVFLCYQSVCFGASGGRNRTTAIAMNSLLHFVFTASPMPPTPWSLACCVVAACLLFLPIRLLECVLARWFLNVGLRSFVLIALISTVAIVTSGAQNLLFCLFGAFIFYLDRKKGDLGVQA